MKTIASIALATFIGTVAIVSPAFGQETSCPVGGVKVHGPATIKTDDKGNTVLVRPWVCSQSK